MRFSNNFIKISVVAGCISLAVSGCNFLNREPLGQYTGSAALNSYVWAMYGSLREPGVTGLPYIGIISIRSDDALKGSTPSDAASTQGQMDEISTLRPDNGLVNDYWIMSYKAIGRANTLITEAENADISPSQKNEYIAEAKFIRAYAYFNLVRAFGGVPIQLTVENINPPRNSAQEVYAQIISDLQAAQGGMVGSWPKEFIGRPTFWSAKSLLAKVYAYQKNWGAVIGLTNEVINNGPYSLITSVPPNTSWPYNNPFAYLFSEYGENCAESIFEIQATQNATYPEGEGEKSYACLYATVQGCRGSGQSNQGWGFNVPSQNLLNAFDESGSGDIRRDVTILNTTVETRYNENLVPASSAPIIYNGKEYTNPIVRATSGLPDGNAGWMNIRILRFADILLLNAEANVSIPSPSPANITEALESLNAVRARAGLTPSTTTNPALLLNEIKAERRLELAMEAERFYDLVRWGDANTVLNDNTVQDGIIAANRSQFILGKSELLPIPQVQIDNSQGVLIQNPGY